MRALYRSSLKLLVWRVCICVYAAVSGQVVERASETRPRRVQSASFDCTRFRVLVDTPTTKKTTAWRRSFLDLMCYDMPVSAHNRML